MEIMFVQEGPGGVRPLGPEGADDEVLEEVTLSATERKLQLMDRFGHTGRPIVELDLHSTYSSRPAFVVPSLMVVMAMPEILHPFLT